MHKLAVYLIRPPDFQGKKCLESRLSTTPPRYQTEAFHITCSLIPVTGGAKDWTWDSTTDCCHWKPLGDGRQSPGEQGHTNVTITIKAGHIGAML